MRTYSHAIPIEHNLPPGPLWPYKHTEKELRAIELADPYNYSAQYEQDPMKRGGNVFDGSWFPRYKIAPEPEWKAIFGDTALKDKELNDFTVFQCWAKYQGKIYHLDQYRKRIKSTELEQVFTDFWNKHNTSIAIPLRAAYVEDKASGTQLIQQIQKNGGIPIIAIPRHKSKIERAYDLLSWIETGLVCLPENAEWVNDYITEFERFTPLMTHKHDDQIDPTLDAIEQMLIQPVEFKATDDSKNRKTTIAPGKSAKIW
jgi:predicted phage terminase large subunit-like protein